MYQHDRRVPGHERRQFYFNGKYMDSDGGIALRLTSGEPEEVEPEEDELSEEMLQIIEESYREAEENGEIPDFDDFDVAELLEDNPIGEILHAPEADVSGKWVAVFDGIGGLPVRRDGFVYCGSDTCKGRMPMEIERRG